MGCITVIGIFAQFLIILILFPFAVVGFTIRYIVLWICPKSSQRVIGIFSRSAPSDYEWITNGLRSAMFRHLVSETKPISISNNVHQFREAAHGCDFVLLYHTKNRGRVNLTNVTDSLYDMELRYLSELKGRVNVIVVIDDLDQGGYEEKNRILREQPDILECSQDLILVTLRDKNNPRTVNEKLEQIKDLISTESHESLNFCSYLRSMTSWVINHVTCCCGRDGREGMYKPLLV
ncbi:uncharacterized protein LOC142097152 [Mixophyes fleayi]|uniref:uncharacterized protein LOC142097152 n=1 Tax=Mixophyes fleayi TaxID=3061075 RepID=UPI003F4D753E